MGDIQRGRRENLYVDAVHYTAAFPRDRKQAGIVPER
jgi:hypothetical protein